MVDHGLLYKIVFSLVIASSITRPSIYLYSIILYFFDSLKN